MFSKFFFETFAEGIFTEAFTLSEVLITLAIIGVVAALTLPALIQSNTEKQTVNRLKKNYSTLSQAFLFVESQIGTPDSSWDLKRQGDGQGAINLLKPFSKYIKQLRICELDRGCFPDVEYKSLDGKNRVNINRANSYARAIINDGTLMYAWVASETCTEKRGNTPQLSNICGAITVDVNGFKRPNTYGRDLFSFYVTKFGIVPEGLPDDIKVSFGGGAKGFCSMSRSNPENGAGCAAWVIMNENLDYIHCPGLSWNGRKKCN